MTTVADTHVGRPHLRSVAAPDHLPPDDVRVQPHDVPAEQCVLGGMLLSKDAIADVVEVLRVGDFYRPQHTTIYDVILDLYGRGEPADAITVAGALENRGDLGKVGGAPYLHTLISSVPTAANAAFYARIVSERATLRRLVDAGTKIVQLGYGSAAGQGRDVDDIVDLAQQTIYDVTERRVSEDFAVLADLLQPTLNEIEAIGNTDGTMRGIPTGFADLDHLLSGLQGGQLVIVAGRPGIGKALAVDTPLPTPDGWTTMGDVSAGDWLLGADGRPTEVLHAFDVMHGRPCFEVEFSDGSVIVADAEHLWATTTRASRRQRSAAKSTPQWPQEARVKADALLREAMSRPDELVTFREAVTIVGQRFQSMMGVIAAEVGSSTKVVRQYERNGKPWQWPVRAYSVQALTAELSRRVNRLMNAETTALPREPVTTEQIAATLLHPVDGRLNHAVDNACALVLPDRDDLPIPPYTLGAWLGDGSSGEARITSADPELVAYVEAEGFVVKPQSGRLVYSIQVPKLPALPERTCVVCGRQFAPKGASVYACSRSCSGPSRGLVPVDERDGCASCGTVTAGMSGVSRRCAPCRERYGSFVGYLRAAGVFGDKHVPVAYLRASEAQRRALLAGLMDTDGTVGSSGSLQFTVTSAKLAAGVRELVVSLGYRCSVTTKQVKGRTAESSTAYTLNFSTADEVFRLERKKTAHKERCRTKNVARTGSRYIVAVRPVPSVPVRCVTVANDDHLYLAGRSMIPTHNSTAALDVARNAAFRNNVPTAIFSLEMSKTELVMRMLSAQGRVPLQLLRSGKLSDEDWTRLARCMAEISEAPMYVDDTPNMNLMEIRAKARRLKQRHDLKLIVVDYLQLMSSPKKTESRQQEVSEISRGLKLLAKEVDCAVIAVSQLNRGPEQRTDKRPQLSDLRESGSIEQDCDIAILLHRDDYYDKESPKAGEADFIVAKHRNGPTDTVTVAAQLHLSRFVDMSAG